MARVHFANVVVVCFTTIATQLLTNMSAESPLDAPVGVDEQPVGEQHARPEAPATESLLETPQDQAGSVHN